MRPDVQAMTKPLFTDKDNALCPLCGAGLAMAPKPQLPCRTLEGLAAHFAGDCPATENVYRPVA